MSSRDRMRLHHVVLSIAAALLFAFNVANATPDQDLLAAVEKGELAKAEKALKKKANPEARGRRNSTALMVAAELGHVDIAKLLLSSGANVATTREGGIAAIHHGSATGTVEMVKLLLASGADVGTRTDAGVTPLMVAGLSGKLDTLKALLEAGASRTDKNNDGMTPFMAAAQSNCVECLQLLRIEGEGINAKTATGTTVLDFAVATRSPEVMTYLFEQGASFDAAKSAKDQWLFALVADPADVLYKRQPATVETLRLLVAHGANLEAKNKAGRTPLMHAAFVGDQTAVQAFVESKADVNARDTDGATALMRAEQRNVVETARMFVAARDAGSVKKMFIPAEKSDKSPATATRLAINRLLLQAGSDVNAVDNNGETPLLHAIKIGDVELVQLLQGAGANVNTANKKGVTALMIASSFNYSECAAALLAAGADPSLATTEGKTALSIAETNDAKDVIKLLKAAQKTT